MVEHFTDLAAVEAEMTVGKVNEAHTHAENEQVDVVTLSHGVKWIITSLITVWLVVHTVLLFEVVTMGVTGEDVLVVSQGQIVVVSVLIIENDHSVAGTSHAIESEISSVGLSNELVVAVGGDDSTECAHGHLGQGIGL